MKGGKCKKCKYCVAIYPNDYYGRDKVVCLLSSHSQKIDDWCIGGVVGKEIPKYCNQFTKKGK